MGATSYPLKSVYLLVEALQRMRTLLVGSLLDQLEFMAITSPAAQSRLSYPLQRTPARLPQPAHVQ